MHDNVQMIWTTQFSRMPWMPLIQYQGELANTPCSPPAQHQRTKYPQKELF